MNNIIEYDECVYGLNKDVQKYLLEEIKNKLNMDGRIIQEDIDFIEKNLNLIIELHNDCHLGMVKLYYNPMCEIEIMEVE